MIEVGAIGLNLTKKTKIISFIVVTVSLVNIMANALLIPILQTIGAALSSLASQLIFFLLIYLFAQRHYFISYEYAKIILVSILGMIIIFGGSMLQDAHLLIRLPIKFLLLAAFPLILYFLNFFDDIEIQRLHGAWIKWNNPLHWKRNVLDLLGPSSS